MVKFIDLVCNTKSWLKLLDYSVHILEYDGNYCELRCKEFSVILIKGFGPRVLAMSWYYDFSNVDKAIDFIESWELK